MMNDAKKEVNEEWRASNRVPTRLRLIRQAVDNEAQAV